jgi:hypothetical protein
MYHDHDLRHLLHLDFSQSFATKPLAKWVKATIWIGLVVALVCALTVAEIQLLISGDLVEVVPE